MHTLSLNFHKNFRVRKKEPETLQEKKIEYDAKSEKEYLHILFCERILRPCTFSSGRQVPKDISNLRGANKIAY